VVQSRVAECASSSAQEAMGVAAGALFIQSAEGSVTDTRFESNIASGGKHFTRGGAAWCSDGVHLVLAGSWLLQNKVHMGSKEDCEGGMPGPQTSRQGELLPPELRSTPPQVHHLPCRYCHVMRCRCARHNRPKHGRCSLHGIRRELGPRLRQRLRWVCLFGK
jgi:hypothetical protein